MYVPVVAFTESIPKPDSNSCIKGDSVQIPRGLHTKKWHGGCIQKNRNRYTMYKLSHYRGPLRGAGPLGMRPPVIFLLPRPETGFFGFLFGRFAMITPYHPVVMSYPFIAS